MKFSRLFLALLLLAAASAPAADTFCLAFGSCNRVDRPQPLWEPILRHKPDVWVWLGDIVYTNTYDMEVLRSTYAQQKESPGYAKLRKATKVVGIWDDHEYGVNDSGAEYPMKKGSQKELLDFLDEPEDSPRRRQEGVYTSYDFGEGNRRLKLILLDGRYHREEPGLKSDMLGEAQWKWLEQQLKNSEARINVIGSNIQVIATQHRFEKWAAFPAARKRLIKLIADSGAKGVIFLSGDRHQAEISMMSDAGAPYPLYDITSSGLTHVAKGNTKEPNIYRVAGPVAELNFGILTVDWASEPVKLTFSIRGVDDTELLGKVVALDTLLPPPEEGSASSK